MTFHQYDVSMPANQSRNLIERGGTVACDLQLARVENQAAADGALAAGADGGRLRIGAFGALVLARRNTFLTRTRKPRAFREDDLIDRIGTARVRHPAKPA